MDAAWWAEPRPGKLGKHSNEHRWTRRRKKQTIWQPLLPDVHWAPVLNERHKQNGPLGREKTIKSDQAASSLFICILLINKNNPFADSSTNQSGWPCGYLSYSLRSNFRKLCWWPSFFTLHCELINWRTAFSEVSHYSVVLIHSMLTCIMLYLQATVTFFIHSAAVVPLMWMLRGSTGSTHWGNDKTIMYLPAYHN